MSGMPDVLGGTTSRRADSSYAAIQVALGEPKFFQEGPDRLTDETEGSNFPCEVMDRPFFERERAIFRSLYFFFLFMAEAKFRSSLGRVGSLQITVRLVTE